YTARKFTHTAELNAKLVYIHNAADNTYTYTIDKNARPVGEIGIEANAKLETTYDQLTNLPSPTSANGTAFCFWYYMQDGKPVQLTRWKQADKADVDLLTKYSFTHDLEIYPMFEDNLPSVSVQYNDTISGAALKQYNKEYVFGKNISEAEMPDPTELQHGEYSFDYWYYTVEEKDKDGNTISTNKTFVFDDGKAKDVTSPMDAAGAPDNFTPVTLRLYAKWTQEIKIANVDDYMAIYNKLRDTAADKKDIERILTANITITGDLKFGDTKLEPLFDSEHIFEGKIDGGKYNESGVVTDKITISGGVFGGKSDASVFGYSDGYISNISFSNIGLALTENDGEYADTVYIGAVTTQNRGTVHNCDVTLSGLQLNKLHTVVFGGISAVNRVKGSAGAITNCRVTLTTFSANCEALTFGGITGMSNPTARVSNCSADVTVSSVVCADDGIAANGRSSLIIGGLVGNNSGHIALSTVLLFKVNNAQSLTDFSFGGVAGVNTGSIRTTHANSVLCSEQAPANVSGSLSQTVSIGGLAGRSEGYVINCYCDIKAYAKINNAPKFGCLVAVGGAVGNNFSNKKDTSTTATSGISAINSCYATGEISVKVDESIENVTVFAGGVAGRNSHNKIGSVFSALNVNVDNKGKSNLGFVVGAMENNSAVKANCYYINSVKLVSNGVEYKRTPGASGDGKDDIETFPITNVGAAMEKAEFATDSVLTKLGFTKDNPWKLSEDKDYPYLVFNSKIYE
ncbi:MAG: hypothetical protein K2M36_02495, partial [Clostridia bacterium]|nr:hypothetical protein [Clostridia bacterium]